MEAAGFLLALLRGDPEAYCVNPEVLKSRRVG